MLFALVLPFGKRCTAQNIQTTGNNTENYTGNGPWAFENTTTGFRIGSSADGTLTVQNGGQVFNNSPSGSGSIGGIAYLGYDAAATGTANISGAGSLWRNDGRIWVGRQGTGYLNVAAGAKVITGHSMTSSNSGAFIGNLAGSHGEVDVSSGASWEHFGAIWLGHSGSGSLNISSGGKVTSGDVRMAQWLGNPTGNASVDGAGSEWSISSSLTVGERGTAELNITNTGHVSTATWGSIGALSTTSSGTVNVTNNGSWTNGTSLTVGGAGTGELNIESGGTVTTGSIGFTTNVGASGQGTVNVNTGGQLEITDEFTVGDHGEGALNIQSGGVVSVIRAASNPNSLIADVYLGRSSLNSNIAPGEGVATISGAGSQFHVDDRLWVGYDGNGTLEVLDGGLVTSDQGRIANRLDGSGTVTVSGLGSRWEIADTLQVSNAGEGTMNVVDQGVVTSLGGSISGNNIGGFGLATVSGTGSQWDTTGADLVVGVIGKGDLNIQSGGMVKSSSATIGNTFNAMTDGTVNVSGGGSHWDISGGDLNVGRWGKGTLNISDGGLVTNGDGHVGRLHSTLSTLSSGTVNVTGAGSQWNNSGSLFVGNSGNGDVTVQDGATLSSAGATIGFASGRTGTVTIKDGSTWNNSGELTAGFFGAGAMNIESGGSVSNTNAFVGVATTFKGAGVGTVNVSGSGSTWSNSGDVSIGGNASGVGSSGLVSISGDSLVSVAGTMELYQSGSVNLSGGKLDVETLDLSDPTATENFNITGGRLVVDSVLGSLKQEGGTLAPGDSPGLTSIQNSYEMLAGSIEFELAGLSRGTEYDAIDIGGNGTLVGTMDVDLIDGFTASEGDSFQLVGAAGILSGLPVFDFSDAVLSSGLAWDTSMFLSDGTIFVAASIPEPTSFMMLGTVLVCFSGRRWMRSRTRLLSTP